MSDSGPADSLDTLRLALDALDTQLLEVATQRLGLVERIRAVKAATGHSQFDRARERALFERARQTCQRLGLDPMVGRQLLETLIEASHHLQESASRAPQRVDGNQRGRPPGDFPAREILIVGGGGQMGQLFQRAFQARGHRVAILEKDDGQNREAHVRRAEVVMLAVPMATAAAVAAEIAPFVGDDSLLFDINSLKTEVCAVMERSCAGEVLGTHPMFGPTVRSLRRQKVVICRVRTGPLSAWLETELGRLGLELIDSDPGAHDHMMAVVQVLVHFRTLVMGEALRRTGVSVADGLRYTSPIYRLELALVGRLFAQDPTLYAEIEMANPEAGAVRRHFVEAAHQLDEIAEAGDRASFEALFSGVAEYFSDFGDEAMRLSDFLIETLVRRP